MATLQDAIMQAIGPPGDLGDRLRRHYGASASEDLNDAEYRWLGDAGALEKTLNDRWRGNLGRAGYTGDLNDQLLAFWLDGGNWGAIPAPPASDIGVVLPEGAPAGRGDFTNNVNPLDDGDSGGISMRLRFDAVAGGTRRTLIQALNETSQERGVELSDDLQTAYLLPFSGEIDVADISSLGLEENLPVVVTLEGSRTGSATTVSISANGQTVTIGSSNWFLTYAHVGPSPAYAAGRAGFTVYSVRVEHPGDSRIYPIEEGSGNTSSPTGAGGDITWSNQTWIGPQVTITVQPQSVVQVVGQSATFSITAQNALTYQWRKNGVDIPGATGPSYNIATVAEADEGIYDCVVAGAGTGNTATSSPAVLNVPDPNTASVLLEGAAGAGGRGVAQAAAPALTVDGQVRSVAFQLNWANQARTGIRTVVQGVPSSPGTDDNALRIFRSGVNAGIRVSGGSEAFVDISSLNISANQDAFLVLHTTRLGAGNFRHELENPASPGRRVELSAGNACGAEWIRVGSDQGTSPGFGKLDNVAIYGPSGTTHWPLNENQGNKATPRLDPELLGDLTFDGTYDWEDASGLTTVRPKGTVPAQAWEVNTPIATLVMSQYFTTPADGTRAPETYAQAGLPTGIDIDPNTGDITGQTAVESSGSVTVTATDNGGAQATQEFNWSTSVGLVTIYNVGVVPDQLTWLEKVPITPFNVAANFSNDQSSPPSYNAASYAVVGGPGGISVAFPSGEVTGTPDTYTESQTQMGIQATDTNAGTTTQNFDYRVKRSPLATDGTIPDQPGWLKGVEITPINTATYYTSPSSSPPTYSPVVFSAVGLPAGVDIDTGTGVISGTPTADPTSALVTVSAISNDPDTAPPVDQPFNFTLSLSPIDTVGSVGTQAWPIEEVITPIQMSGFFTNDTSDPPTYNPASYAIAGEPAGIVINPTTGEISGTPTTLSSGTITVTATDTQSNQAQQQFGWDVTPQAIRNVGTIPDQLDWRRGVAIAPLDVSGNFSGLGSTPPSYDAASYQILGGPGGLSISGAGIITGTPATQVEVPTLMGVEATDTQSNTATQTFDFLSKLTPIAADGVVPAQDDWRKQVAIVNLDMNQYFTSGSSDPPAYDPDTWADSGFPSGVSVNALGVLTGTPDATTNPGPGTGTVTVTDADGNQAQQTVNFTLSLSPIAAIPGQGPYTWTENQAIVPIQASTFFTDGSSTPPTYDPNPGTYSALGLPTGVAINPTTGEISGTPTVTGASTFTVSVQDTQGNPATTDTISYTVQSSGPAVDAWVAFGQGQVPTGTGLFEITANKTLPSAPIGVFGYAVNDPNGTVTDFGAMMFGAAVGSEGTDRAECGAMWAGGNAGNNTLSQNFTDAFMKWSDTAARMNITAVQPTAQGWQFRNNLAEGDNRTLNLIFIGGADASANTFGFNIGNEGQTNTEQLAAGTGSGQFLIEGMIAFTAALDLQTGNPSTQFIRGSLGFADLRASGGQYSCGQTMAVARTNDRSGIDVRQNLAITIPDSNTLGNHQAQMSFSNPTASGEYDATTVTRNTGSNYWFGGLAFNLGGVPFTVTDYLPPTIAANEWREEYGFPVDGVLSAHVSLETMNSEAIENPFAAVIGVTGWFNANTGSPSANGNLNYPNTGAGTRLSQMQDDLLTINDSIGTTQLYRILNKDPRTRLTETGTLVDAQDVALVQNPVRQGFALVLGRASVPALPAIQALGTVPAQSWAETQGHGTLRMSKYFTNNVTAPATYNPASYSIASGSLPSGRGLDTTTGDIIGNPDPGTAGAGSVTIRATDTQGSTALQPFSWTVGPAKDVWMAFGELTLPVTTGNFSVTAPATLPGPVKAVQCELVNDALGGGGIDGSVGLSVGFACAGVNAGVMVSNTNNGERRQLYDDAVLKIHSGSTWNIGISSVGPVTDGWEFNFYQRQTGLNRTIKVTFYGGADLDVNAGVGVWGLDGTVKETMAAGTGSGQFAPDFVQVAGCVNENQTGEPTSSIPRFQYGMADLRAGGVQRGFGSSLRRFANGQAAKMIDNGVFCSPAEDGTTDFGKLSIENPQSDGFDARSFESSSGSNDRGYAYLAMKFNDHPIYFAPDLAPPTTPDANWIEDVGVELQGLVTFQTLIGAIDQHYVLAPPAATMGFSTWFGPDASSLQVQFESTPTGTSSQSLYDGDISQLNESDTTAAFDITNEGAGTGFRGAEFVVEAGDVAGVFTANPVRWLAFGIVT